MKFSLSSFLFGMAATAVLKLAKDKGFFRSVFGRVKLQPTGERTTATSLPIDPGKRAVSVISEIA